jgi:2-polyprenyl-3-methyl-5-hydroxy-6-metoxy-1,4-benzoquinol methylase
VNLYTDEQVAEAESCARDQAAAMTALRKMTLDGFGQLLLGMPDKKYPKLSKFLPIATPDSVQKQWVGSSGETLLRQSVSFCNFLSANYTEFTGRALSRASILDFGCGWGRLLRLMLFYTDAANLYGCDAWEVSLKLAMDARIGAKLAQSETIPEELPFGDTQFDLIYAFSVFTHLSEKATLAAIAAMRKKIAKGGLLIITIRPPDFWAYTSELNKRDFSAYARIHAAKGFAYWPWQDDVKQHFGDTSMTEAYMRENFHGWNIRRMGSSFIDPYQIFVCLTPV